MLELNEKVRVIRHTGGTAMKNYRKTDYFETGSDISITKRCHFDNEEVS